MKKGGEEAYQIVVMNWLKRQDYEIWERTFHCPNGGLRNKREASRLKLMGVKPGVPDLISLRGNVNYCGIVQELKDEDGVLSEDQKKMLKYFKEIGFACYTPYSLDACVTNYCLFYDFKEIMPLNGAICGFE